VIGTAVPASPELETAKGAAGDQRSDLRRQAMLRLFREPMRASREEAPEEVIVISRDAVLSVLRSVMSKARRGMGLPQEGPWNIGRL
jgi:hypothetical protein